MIHLHIFIVWDFYPLLINNILMIQLQILMPQNLQILPMCYSVYFDVPIRYFMDPAAYSGDPVGFFIFNKIGSHTMLYVN